MEFPRFFQTAMAEQNSLDIELREIVEALMDKLARAALWRNARKVGYPKNGQNPMLYRMSSTEYYAEYGILNYIESIIFQYGRFYILRVGT